MFNSNIQATGRLSVVLKDESGAIKDSREINNLVVTTGLGYIASRMKDATADAMSHMAIGSGTAAAAAGNTSVGSQLARQALTSTTVAGGVVTYAASFSSGTGTGAVTEAGIFNDPTAGTMLCRTVFDVVNKGANDTLAITWTITLSAS
tara:strand:- start:860 stop:1306 length:447 start_codon:yes stop_codon:yes gene_type:complete